VGKKYNVRERGGGKNIVFGQLYTPLTCGDIYIHFQL
jgi:hypothetical protein